LGILGGKTSGYFLTSECNNYLRFISGYVSTSGIYGSWSSGPKTSLTSLCRYIHFLSEFYFRSELHFQFNAHSSTSSRSWPGYHGGGRSCTRTGDGECRIGFPGRWDGTQLARQIGATYVRQLDPYFYVKKGFYMYYVFFSVYATCMYCIVCCLWRSLKINDIYLRQGGYVFTFVCLSVCLSVNRIPEKNYWTNLCEILWNGWT